MSFIEREASVKGEAVPKSQDSGDTDFALLRSFSANGESRGEQTRQNDEGNVGSDCEPRRRHGR